MRQGQYSDQVIAIVTTWLHRQKQHHDAVEGLLAAIRNGLAEPWMYDVLAVEMKLAKRPQKQIDRVLVSRIDFAAGNDAQMLVAASTLAGFDAFEEALGICKELAKKSPHQPELWSTARRVADLSGDQRERTWARVQTIRNVWEPGYETLHAKMEAELQDMMTASVKAGDQAAGSMIREALSDATRQDLRVRIEWVGDGDLDLAVTEPDGAVCNRRQQVTRNGGLLVKHDTVNESTGRKRAEEYVCIDALTGKYQIQIQHIDGRILLGRVQVKVTRNAGTAAEKTDVVSLAGVVEMPQETTFTYE